MRFSLKEIYDYFINNDQFLKEANLKHLYDQTANETPKVAARGKQLLNDVRYFGLSKDGTLNFKVKSQTVPGRYYYMYIEAPDIIRFGEQIDEGQAFLDKDLSILLTMNGFRVMSSDPSFLYWAWQYKATVGNYEIEPETRAPKRNNTLLKGALNKHLFATIENLFTNKNIRAHIVKDINNYLRMLSGFDYEDYQQENHARQIQQQNRAVKWKNNPTDYMNEYFARQAKNHSFLDDKDIKKSLRSEVTKFVRANLDADVDAFLRDYFNMTLKAFANDMMVPENSVEEYFEELGFSKKQSTWQKRVDSRKQKEDESKGISSGILTKESEGNLITIYRAVIADDEKEANKYINSTTRYSASDYGPGIYWSTNIDVVRYYGNFIYKAEVHEHQIKKKIDSQNIVILTADTHKSLSKALVASVDVGINSRYTFHPSAWEGHKLFKESEQIQEDKYKQYLSLHKEVVSDVFKKLIDLAEDWKEDNFLDENQDHPFTWILDNQSTLTTLVEEHDDSKYNEEEFEPYRKHFYPVDDEESLNTEEFKNATFHHITNNSHHWEFWCELGEDGLFTLKDDIDEHSYLLSVIERACDNACMSQFYNNRVRDWYDENKDSMVLPDFSIKFYEDLIDIITEHNLDIDEEVYNKYKEIAGKLNEAEKIDPIDIKDRDNVYVHTDRVSYTTLGGYPAFGAGYYLFHINSVDDTIWRPNEEGDNKYYRLTNSSNIVIAPKDNYPLEFDEQQLDDIEEGVISRGKTFDKERFKSLAVNLQMHRLYSLFRNEMVDIMREAGIDAILIIDVSNAYDEPIKNELCVYNPSIIVELDLNEEMIYYEENR